jgi:hypothetical protein
MSKDEPVYCTCDHLQTNDSREIAFIVFLIHGHFEIYVFRPMAFCTWLREYGLLFDSLKCHCCKSCATDGYSFRCRSGNIFVIIIIIISTVDRIWASLMVHLWHMKGNMGSFVVEIPNVTTTNKTA